MGHILSSLLSELEACRGEDVCKAALASEATHVLQLPMTHKTCDELQALARVFDCEPAHLAFLIMKSALAEIHEGLDDDLDQLALTARDTIEAQGE